MIIETTYTAESKKERKALQMMHINMQDAGMDVEFRDEHSPHAGDKEMGQVIAARLTVKESRRKRRSSQEVAEAALTEHGDVRVYP